MNIEGNIEDPIVIRLGKNTNTIMPDKVNKEECPLKPGAIIGGKHYGFVLIIDYNGRQKEIVYPTQCRISAAGMQDKILYIFEEKKRIPWKFNESGNLIYSAFGDFEEEFITKYSAITEYNRLFIGKPILKNPLNIRISFDPDRSVILKDELVQKDYPLHPGVVLESEHYGFIIKKETEKGIKKIVYPTQNRIDAVGIENDVYGDLKIFENGKYHPWIFTCEGELKNEASYNPLSKRDIKYIEDTYGINSEEATKHFNLKIKK